MGKSPLIAIALLVLTATNAASNDRQNIIPDAKDGRADRKCMMPFISNSERLVVINSHNGSYVSTVTTTEQGDAGYTSAAKIAVKQQTKPLHLLLISNEAIIYDFVEGPENVEHVYLVSERKHEGLEVSANGVINMPKKKVTFLTRDCEGSFYEFAGGKPDNISRKQAFTKATIHADTVEFDPWTKRGNTLPVKAGFEESQWNYAVEYHADGIMEIDPRDVYSKRRAEKYEVMPNLFGVAQLLYEGKIEKTDDPNIFRIVKPIPYFPQGLQGGLSRDFIVDAGLPLPKGNIGHSCIKHYNSAGDLVIEGSDRCRSE